MRRLFSLLMVLVVTAGIAMALPMVTKGGDLALQVTLPGTNTPPPLVFATNTAAGPTETLTATTIPSATPTNTVVPTDTPAPTATPDGPFVYPEDVNPLTGLPYTSADAMARRNLIVKISNYPPIVRPQSGVNQADLVYEYETEGGVTRFAAIFRNNAPTHVGSVRSARLIDLQLVPMYQALLAYSGTSAPIQNLILHNPDDPDFTFFAFSPLKGDNCEEAGFCRFPKDGLAFEHTLFLDTTKLWAEATQRNVNTGYKARGFAFSPTPDPSGKPINDVLINWYGTNARWQYDDASGHWLRYTDGVAHYDALDNQQLWADNLVIIEVPHDDHPAIFPPGASYTSIDIQLQGQGRAYLLRDGMLYQGYWRRRSTNPGDALQIIYGNNQSIMLKPGRTWVSVVRGLGNVTLSDQKADMVATATALASIASPTPNPNAQDTSDSGG